ncbi:MAG: DUF5103 domain-containing protein [Cytophagales bacterium]|nr:DUF5103 domain-containing protein [Cytophagales bacterium]
MKYTSSLLIILLTFGWTFGQRRPKPVKDQVFNSKIKTIQLYAIHNQKPDLFSLPVIELRKNAYLQLEFDAWEEDANNYIAKIIHCHADWTPSRLLPLQYLRDYNETLIEDYDFSSNTLVYYTHYKLRVPPVKRSGNYALAVYHEDDEETPLFTKRFAVVEQLSRIQAEVAPSFTPKFLNQKQRIKFEIQTSSIDLKDPYNQIIVHLYQNKNWNSVKDKLKPTRYRFDKNTIQYDHFTGENEFFGGNEYRFFDLRSLGFNGVNVGRIDKTNKYYQAFLTYNKPQGKESYSQIRDLNGNYFVDNTDVNKGLIEADYVLTHFQLKSDFLGDQQPVYVLGEFNQHAPSPACQMSYNTELKSYQYAVWLKQGFYNYKFSTEKDNHGGNLLEGNHFETENAYYILVYYKDTGDLSNRLIGFKKITYRDKSNQ